MLIPTIDNCTYTRKPASEVQVGEFVCVNDGSSRIKFGKVTCVSDIYYIDAIQMIQLTMFITDTGLDLNSSDEFESSITLVQNYKTSDKVDVVATKTKKKKKATTQVIYYPRVSDGDKIVSPCKNNASRLQVFKLKLLKTIDSHNVTSFDTSPEFPNFYVVVNEHKKHKIKHE